MLLGETMRSPASARRGPPPSALAIGRGGPNPATRVGLALARASREKGWARWELDT